jgi:hypothetical protein
MSGDLEGHCAGEQGCTPFLTGPALTHRETEIMFDKSLLKLPISHYKKIKIRLRLASAHLEDTFPRLYELLKLPKQYNRQY